MGLNERLKKIEQRHTVSNYAPVLILNPDEIEANRHLIGPNTVVIVDDIPREKYGSTLKDWVQ